MYIQFTYAKYVYSSIWNYYLNSKGFYFSSDYLGSNTIENVNNLWNGSSVYFNVKNNLNNNVVTDYDIGYNVVCTIKGDAATHSECHLNGNSSNTQSGVLTNIQSCVNIKEDQTDVSGLNKTDCELGGYEWESQIATNELYFDVAVTDDSYQLSDVVVNIVVTSTSPYVKALSGDFTLHKITNNENKINLNFKNYSNYNRLVISNSYLESKCIRVSWDSNKMLIDSNSGQFSSYETDTNNYINAIKLNINSKESLNYIFYSRNFGVTYTVDDFSLEEISEC